MIAQRLNAFAGLTKRNLFINTQNSETSSVWSANIIKERTKSLMASIPYPTRLNSLSPPPDQETSVTTSISSPLSTTGSIKTESITNTNPILEELNSTPSVLSTTQVCSTLLDSTPSVLLAEWTDGPDTTEIPTWKSISQNSLPLKSSKSCGTEPQSLSEDWLNNKSSKKTSTQLKRFSTRVQKSFWPQLAEAAFWSVQLFVPIWVVFPFHIWVTITDTSVSVTVQFTTSSVESDKDQPSRTCHTLITQSTRTALWFVLKLLSSQENHPSDSGLDFICPKSHILYSFSSSIYFYLFTNLSNKLTITSLEFIKFKENLHYSKKLYNNQRKSTTYNKNKQRKSTTYNKQRKSTT